MKKTIIVLTAVAVVGIGSAFTSSPVQANSVNQLENKQTEIKSERSEIKANLSKADAKIADVLFDLKELNEDIVRVEGALKENKKMMKNAKTDISKSEEEMETLETEITELEEGIEARLEILKDRATSYQRNGGDIGYLEVLVGSKNFGEFLSRTSAVTKITESDAELMEKQEEDKAQVEIRQEKVEGKLEEQKAMKVELEEIEGIISDQQKQNEKDKKELVKKEKHLTTLKADLENKDGSLAALEAEIRQDISSARNPVVVSSQETSTNPSASTSTSANSSTNSSTNSNASTSTSAETSSSSDKNLKTLSSNTTQPPVGSGIGSVIGAGNRFIGNSSYVYGAADAQGGRFDCSGFVNWAFSQGGYSVPRSTGALVNSGTAVSSSNMQPGDLVFFNTNGNNGHVGIYIGGGNFIGSQSSTGVAIQSLTSGYWKGQFSGTVRRIN